LPLALKREVAENQGFRQLPDLGQNLIFSKNSIKDFLDSLEQFIKYKGCCFIGLAASFIQKIGTRGDLGLSSKKIKSNTKKIDKFCLKKNLPILTK
jgi:hypothetical protein